MSYQITRFLLCDLCRWFQPVRHAACAAYHREPIDIDDACPPIAVEFQVDPASRSKKDASIARAHPLSWLWCGRARCGDPRWLLEVGVDRELTRSSQTDNLRDSIGAHSSAGEHCLHTAGVGGSIPPAPTTSARRKSQPSAGFFACAHRYDRCDRGVSPLLSTMTRHPLPSATGLEASCPEPS